MPLKLYKIERLVGAGVLAVMMGVANASDMPLTAGDSGQPESVPSAQVAPALGGGVQAEPARTEEPAQADPAKADKAELERGGPLLGTDDLGRALAAFYQKNGDSPLWVSDAGPLPRSDALMEVLSGAEREGLDHGPYKLDQIRDLLAQATPEARRDADALISRSALLFSLDRLLGQTRRDISLAQKRGLLQAEEKTTVEDLIAGLSGAPDVKAYLDTLKPLSPQYDGLSRELTRLEEASSTVAVHEKIGAGKSLRVGDRDDRVPMIRARLAGDPAPDPLVYDEDLAEKVKAFQKAQLLKDDGILGAQTLAELNRGHEEQITQIRLALERWRLLPRDLGRDYVLVNVPQTDLFLVDNGTEVLRMKVAVGSPGKYATPIFSDAIRYMEFNPYWNVPTSIAQDETVPSQMRNPDYLARRGFTAMTHSGEEVSLDSIDWSDPDYVARAYRFRQNPGAGNALGSVKFMFPNQYSVYLHDTNAPGVFQRDNRAVSHGCVRVSNPRGLADYILQKHTNRTGQTFESFKGPSPRTVFLTTPLPIHLVYITAFAEENPSQVRYFPDIYKLDGALAKRLKDTTRPSTGPKETDSKETESGKVPQGSGA